MITLLVTKFMFWAYGVQMTQATKEACISISCIECFIAVIIMAIMISIKNVGD